MGAYELLVAASRLGAKRPYISLLSIASILGRDNYFLWEEPEGDGEQCSKNISCLAKSAKKNRARGAMRTKIEHVLSANQVLCLTSKKFVHSLLPNKKK